MKRLFHCKSCGFLSTVGSSFKIIDGKLTCTECKKDEKVKKEKVFQETADN